MNPPRLSRTRMLVITLLASGAFGFTSCPYFSTVTVPGSDTKPPDTYGGAYDRDTATYASVGLNDQSSSYAVAYEQLVVAYAAGIDAGGTKSLSVSWITDYSCCSANGTCRKSLGVVRDESTETQPGSTGSTVSSGIWLGKTFEPKTLLEKYCGDLAPTSKIALRFTVTAQDFKGNTRTSATQRMSFGF